MDNTIIVSLISGICVAIPSIIATLTSNRSSKKLIDYKLNELTKHVIEHNGLIDRMYKVETRVTLLEDERKIKNEK